MPERTISQCVADAQRRLSEAGVDSASLDAQLLLAHLLNAGREYIWAYPEKVISSELCETYEALVARRESREPFAYIVGTKEFFSHQFYVSPAVLIPRPDSEVLVEKILALKSSREGRAQTIADMGVGSGCLLLSVLHDWPELKGLGVDISGDAIAVAKRNAELLNVSERVEWCHSDWDASWPDEWDKVDILMSNPPYIDPEERAGLAPELDYEPEGALTADQHGLAAYEALVHVAERRLASGGVMLLEFGSKQAQAVSDIMQHAGLRVREIIRDLAGHERGLIAEKL